MNITSEFDTIAAISTPPGEGALHIVRLSGEDALSIIDQIYRQGTKKLSAVPSHTIHYGHIIDPKTEDVIDEVMVTVMKAPKTYTREDVVEINCHGGVVVVNEVLQLLLRVGARLAEPGEFTKRAFLNGRIDLSQAEAVIDLITAKTANSREMAVQQLDGKLSTWIREVRGKIFQTLGEVEVNIDYPEYDDVELVTSEKLNQCAGKVITELDEVLASATQGKILRDGLATAIIGRPNVGKSSLLNDLLREDKAIVTDIAGTTRDVIEEYVNVEGVPLKLIDTAGIRETEDIVEQIGVERSRKALAEADLVLLLLNNNEELGEEDIALLKATEDSDRIIILNKMDLPSHLDRTELQKYLKPNENFLEISIRAQEGVRQVGKSIHDRFFQGEIQRDHLYISNIRHIHLLEEAKSALEEVQQAIGMGLPIDLCQMDMVRAWNLLGEITGDSVQDELLDQLFSNFCLGK